MLHLGTEETPGLTNVNMGFAAGWEKALFLVTWKVLVVLFLSAAIANKLSYSSFIETL